MRWLLIVLALSVAGCAGGQSVPLPPFQPVAQADRIPATVLAEETRGCMVSCGGKAMCPAYCQCTTNYVSENVDYTTYINVMSRSRRGDLTDADTARLARMAAFCLSRAAP